MNPNNDFKETEKKNLKIKNDLVELFRKQKEKMIFENNSYTDWFKKMIIDEDLLGYFENSLPELTGFLYKHMTRDCIQYGCKQDIQYLNVDYIAPISPDEIDFGEWKKSREQKLLKWGDYHSLNRIYIDYNGGKILKLTSLPVVARIYDLERKVNKFTIGDGNHRFGFAKRNNITTVMSLVHDTYIIRKSWVEKIIDQLKKAKKARLQIWRNGNH